MFNPKYKKYHCDNKEWYTSKNLEEFVNARLSLDPGDNYLFDSYGDTVSTIAQGRLIYQPFKRIASELENWILEKILENGEYFFGRKIKSARVVRFWINRENKGARVKIHIHNRDADIDPERDVDLVAVFYPAASLESGALTIVKDGVWGTFVEDYPDEQLVKIPVQTGDLVMHCAGEPHGVTEYQGTDPRICFVFNYRMIFEDL